MADKPQQQDTSSRFLPWRFGMFLVLTLAIPALILFGVEPGTAALAGYDVAALAFILSTWPLFYDEADEMRRDAQRNDAGRPLALGITIVTLAIVLVAIGVEMSGEPTVWDKVLVIATLLLAWLFSNLVFAIHYAHIYYGRGDEGEDARGLDIPECDTPDYADFAYYAFTIGMTFQTSDTEVTSRKMRRTTLLHSMAAFLFNIGVVAFTINALAQG